MNRDTIRLVAYLCAVAAAVAGLLSCHVAKAETVQIAIRGSARCETGQCQPVTAYASGVTIGELPDGTDAILTAAHSYRGISNYRTTVSWFGETNVPARVVAIGGSVDAAVLSVRLPSRPQCRPLLDRIETGDPIASVGFSEGNKSQTRRGTWNGSIVPGVFPRHGESGGPVFASGGIAGVIVGYDSEGMVVETCQRIRGWMVSVGCYPVCPAVVQPPPVRPIQVAPGVQRPSPQPPAAVVAGCDCDSRITELRAMLSAERQRASSQAGLILSLEQRIKAIEQHELSVVIKENGKEVDRDKYEIFSEPLVLDFQQKQASKKPVTPPAK